jgi:hypothetical protein
MAGADKGQKLQQRDAGFFQELSEAEPSTQLENHRANQGRVDTGLSLGGPHTTSRNRAGGEGSKVQTHNQNSPSARMVLAERI